MNLPIGTGWIPDPPDDRDLDATHPDVTKTLSKAAVDRAKDAKLPGKVDLREWFPPAFNQGSLDSCTANTTAGLVSYFEKRAHGKEFIASRLFNYKAARDLLHQSKDTGAYLRTAMQSLAMFGVPAEEYWPYVAAYVNYEPPAFCYAMGDRYKAIQYFRYDPPGTPKEDVLQSLRAHLASGLPSMFGFLIYTSFYGASETGKIPMPTSGDTYSASHAMVACGYDDEMVIPNHNPKTGQSSETTGAFLVRNSWGAQWGENGYGWLPYEFVLANLATDWWSLVKESWIDTGVFSAKPPADPAESSDQQSDA